MHVIVALDNAVVVNAGAGVGVDVHAVGATLCLTAARLEPVFGGGGRGGMSAVCDRTLIFCCSFAYSASRGRPKRIAALVSPTAQVQEMGRRTGVSEHERAAPNRRNGSGTPPPPPRNAVAPGDPQGALMGSGEHHGGHQVEPTPGDSRCAYPYTYLYPCPYPYPYPCGCPTEETVANGPPCQVSPPGGIAWDPSQRGFVALACGSGVLGQGPCLTV